MYRFMKRFLSLFIAIAMIFTSSQFTSKVYAADIPRPTDPYTQKGMLALLKEYNADAYHIVSTEINKYGSDPSVWFVFSDNIMSDLDTAVHETFHGYSYDTAGIFGYSENIYVGDGKSYILDYSNIPLFETSEVFEDLDPSLKTGRFNQYVSTTSVASANLYGVYGLINEFTAYYWGLNTMFSLLDYYIEYDTDNTGWKEYASSLANNMNAYAEFRYWILSYMLYAKDKHPKTYKAILNDKEFCTAYTEMNDRFATLIDNNLGANTKFNEALAERNCAIIASGGIYFYENDTFSGKDLNDFITLMTEMNGNDRYKEISKKIEENATSSGKTNGKNIVDGIEKPSKPVWSGIRRKSNGIELKWEEINDVTGYYIFRSTNGSTYRRVKKIKNAANTTWVDHKAKDKGSTYKYKIKAYTSKNNKTVSGKFSSVISSD